MNQGIHHHLSKNEWLYAKWELARYPSPRRLYHENIPEKRRQFGPSDGRRNQRRAVLHSVRHSNWNIA